MLSFTASSRYNCWCDGGQQMQSYKKLKDYQIKDEGYENMIFTIQFACKIDVEAYRSLQDVPK